MPGHSKDRIAEDIKREIIATLKDIKDPRVTDELLTVVRVTVSGDLSYAKVYISDLKGMENAKEAAKALNGAAGFIRREVANNMRLRIVPELHFKQDNSLEEAAAIGRRIDEVIAEDERKARERMKNEPEQAE